MEWEGRIRVRVKALVVEGNLRCEWRENWRSERLDGIF
jgi:hypothetical protein